MKLASTLLISLVAVEHMYILWLEMFVWTTRGRTVFKSLPGDLFEKTKTLAANQGLYNGFLAAGLVWALLISDPTWQFNVACFFLTCISIAGIYGGITAQRSIFVKQGVPALISLLVTILA